MDLLTHVETFVATAEHGSFTRAAEDLAIPQPLLSRRIRSLEAVWGGPLFERSSRRVALTPLAELALPPARDLLARARRLADVVSAGGAQALLALGLPGDLAPTGLAGILAVGERAGVALALREGPPAERSRGLAEGDLALALLVGGAEPEWAIDVPLGLAGVPAERRTGGARPVRLDDLRPRRGGSPPRLLCLAEDASAPVAARLAGALARAGVSERRLVEAETAAAAAAEVLAGRGRLVCDAGLARRLGLGWAPFADAELRRDYRLELAPGSTRRPPPGFVDRLVPALRAAVGAPRAPAPSVAESPDPLVPSG